MSAVDVAQEYTRRRWSPIPVSVRAKKPIIDEWQNLRLGEEDIPKYFRGRCNIGILLGDPSNGLIDIDIDAVGISDLVERFLPATRAIFGRPGKPRSHRLYAATEPVRTIKFKAPMTGEMLVEIRSTGAQTVFPGSVHPSGEPINWEVDDEPERVSPETLVVAVGKLAVAVLLRKHLPEREAEILSMPMAEWARALDGVDSESGFQARCWLKLAAPETYAAAPTSSHAPGSAWREKDALARHCLDKAVADIKSARPGGQHDALRDKSFWIACIAKAGGLDWSSARQALLGAGRAMAHDATRGPWVDRELVAVVDGGWTKATPASAPADSARWRDSRRHEPQRPNDSNGATADTGPFGPEPSPKSDVAPEMARDTETAPAQAKPAATDIVGDEGAGTMKTDGAALQPAPIDDAAAEAEIDRLSTLARLPYVRQLDASARAIGIPKGSLDKLVIAKRREAEGEDETGGQGRAIDLPEPEPWSSLVDGAVLLSEITAEIRRYMVMADGAAESVALWTVHAHALDAFGISPRLAITSPRPQCGKTTLLDLAYHLVTRPLLMANISAAAVFRTVERACPVLLADEADTWLHGNDELRGILNSGHRRGGSVIRVVGEDLEPRQFSTWGACAIALIGKLPLTLADRSIPITLQRKRPDETVERFRFDRTETLDTLARKAARWAKDNIGRLADMDPITPDALSNRSADNWRPLLAIADAAGGT